MVTLLKEIAAKWGITVIDLWNEPSFCSVSPEDYSRYMTDAELVEMGMAPVDSSAIDRFESMIETCSQVSSIDPAVMSIIREEMPAYFSGQKTLDDVIVIMEDRVQTFINERG